MRNAQDLATALINKSKDVADEQARQIILYDFTDVLDRMHLPFPLTTRYLHPEVSHKNK